MLIYILKSAYKIFKCWLCQLTSHVYIQIEISTSCRKRYILARYRSACDHRVSWEHLYSPLSSRFTLVSQRGWGETPGGLPGALGSHLPFHYVYAGEFL